MEEHASGRPSRRVLAPTSFLVGIGGRDWFRSCSQPESFTLRWEGDELDLNLKHGPPIWLQ
jgi:hypothetical protein